MKLDVDLFVSGSPNGDQRWPNNSEDMFCKQFFALETDTSKECDFFIEVRTSPEGQRCGYYSYVHRKDVFGLVNGNKRKGAYFAMILRFKGIFCNTPRNIYSLMDMVYRNKIEDSIIEKTSTGESYLVESFASKNDKLREIENLFASQLSVIVNNLKPLDSSFASSQSGKIISYNLYEKDDAIIMEALRKHLKVHLLAFANDQSGVIEGFKSQLSSKDKTLNDLNTKYAELLTEKQSIESSFNDYKNKAESRYKGYQQRIDSLEQEKQSLLGQIDELRAQLQEVDQLPALHEWILEYARKNGIGKGPSHGDNDEVSDTGRGRWLTSSWIKSLKKYWPYFAAIIIVILIILLFLKLFVPSNPDKVSKSAKQQYELRIDELSSSNSKLTAQINDLKDSLDKANTILIGIKGVVSDKNGGGVGSNTVTLSSIIRADVEPISNGTIIGTAQIVPMTTGLTWKIKEGNEYAQQKKSSLTVTQNGTIKIVLVTSNGVEIPGTERQLKVKKQ